MSFKNKEKKLQKITALFILSIFTLVLLAASAASSEKPKIFYVNSYHKGYRWSDDIEKGLLKALSVKTRPDGSFDYSQSKAVLRIFRMDTKRKKTVGAIQQAAFNAKKVIDAWKPDIVVTSDDNAAKYLIAPYYKTTSIPFVFCGLNWDASIYGLPAPNVTGMVEIAPILETIELLKKYADGNRIGYIGADEYSNRKAVSFHKSVLNIEYTDGRFVSDFNEWKEAYLKMQISVDMLICLNPLTVRGWNSRQAEEFILANTKVPSGCPGDPVARFALMAKVKIAEEQGWWAGRTALRILSGISPAKIPVEKNKSSRLILNMKLADRLGIKFPMNLIEKATLVEELPKRRKGP